MKKMNIRTKLMVVFMLLFTLALLAAFIWFHTFATQQAMRSLRQDLMNSATIAASMIDVEEHNALVAGGTQGDAAYMQIADQLMLVYNSNENITDVYTMVPSTASSEFIFIVDTGTAYPVEVYETGQPEEGEAVFMGRSFDVTNYPELPEGCNGPTADKKASTDEYGSWLSGYAPIPGASGGCAIVGVDMDADDVKAVQNQVRNASLIAFVISLAAAFAAVYWLSGAITKNLRLITDASVSLEKGEAYDPGALVSVTDDQDEIGNLARVFNKMALQVQAREKELRQTVSTLKIEIDDMKRKSQVSEITENAEFKELQEKARAHRRQRLEEDKKE